MWKFTEHNHSEQSYIQEDMDVDDEQFPLDLQNIKHMQEQDKDLQPRVATNKKYKEEVIMDVSLITYEGKIYVPPCLTSDTLNWYHHYL